MSEQITLSVPDNPESIRAARDFFQRLLDENPAAGALPAPADPTPEPAAAPDPAPAAAADPVPDPTPEPTAAPAATPGVYPATVDPELGVDAEGIPWDSRIHSSNKKKVAAGTWRAKKNVDPAQVAQVKAELLQLKNTPPAAQQQADPASNIGQAQSITASENPNPGGVPDPTTDPGAGVPDPQPAAATEPAPAGPAPQPGTPEAQQAFTEFLAWATSQDGMDTPKMNQAAAKLGLANIMALHQRPDLIEAAKLAVIDICQNTAAA